MVVCFGVFSSKLKVQKPQERQKLGKMDCDGSTTGDDSTEDEEDTETAGVNVNNGLKTRWQAKLLQPGRR